MQNLLQRVLKVNANWQPIATISARQAFEDAFAGAVHFIKFEEGYPTPIGIDEWIKLPCPNGSDVIRTGMDNTILVPRVCIAINFSRIIAKEQRLTTETLAKNYNYTCAVTGRPLTKEQWSREHVRPRSKGGGSGWHNEVLMDKNLNSARGNKSYRKLGLRKPKIKPPPRAKLPFTSITNDEGFQEWKLFNIPDPPPPQNDSLASRGHPGP